jgi:hypothetical protein
MSNKVCPHDLPPEFWRDCAVSSASGAAADDPGVRRMFCRLHKVFKQIYDQQVFASGLLPAAREKPTGGLQWD